MSVDSDTPTAKSTPQRILLGVTGGIAAYKSAELIRELTRAECEVQVVMSDNAAQFITPLTLQALSGHPVRCELFDTAAEAAMGHIELARWADQIIIAPASADFIARLAAGIANDLLTTLCLATPAPITVAPAMNQQMWAAKATQRNMQQITADGVTVIGPASGDQACGDVGAGRMEEPAEIASQLLAVVDPFYPDSPESPDAQLGAQDPVACDLRGQHIVITAGPTREPLDPVRYVTNHSSGRQGFALAQQACAAGARVSLIAGPVELETPPGVTRYDIQTAEEMLDHARTLCRSADAFISVAAIADFRPRQVADQKIKKKQDSNELVLTLVANPDVLATIAQEFPDLVTVGFAAETERVLEHARAKRARKGVDLIVANDVSDLSIGFAGSHNAVTVISEDGEQALQRSDKSSVARFILEQMAPVLGARNRSTGKQPAG